MKIALFGKTINKEFSGYIQQLIVKLESHNIKIFIYKNFYNDINDIIKFNNKVFLFDKREEIRDVDFLFSIGGDGTLLNTITLVENSNIPILGINTGRLGFLSSISKEEIEMAIDNILNKNYILDKRTLLKLEVKNNLFGKYNYALNEITIQKKDSAMILIHTYINNELLNSYLGDGLIIATPTGSTAYSLSCGGPIITPDSKNIIITPIATHNLTVRPVVIPDDKIIKLNIRGRGKNFLVSLDSRTESIDSSFELIIKKEKFTVNLIQMRDRTIFTTIRNKLMWGLDIRN